MEKLWVSEVVLASICKSKLLILLFGMCLGCNASYSQDSVFVIRRNNILKYEKRIDIDSSTFDSLLLYKPLYVCIEPLNLIARLYSSNKSNGHLYPICYYDSKQRNELTLHFLD